MGEYKEDSFVQDARISLLAHCSSKSSNETAILVGLAVAFFADIQAYSAINFLPEWLRYTVFAWSLGVKFTITNQPKKSGYAKVIVE